MPLNFEVGGNLRDHVMHRTHLSRNCIYKISDKLSPVSLRLLEQFHVPTARALARQPDLLAL